MSDKKRSIKNKKDLEIQKYLCVSTAHITEEENQELLAAPETTYPLSVYSNEYGHIVYVPHDEGWDDFKEQIGKTSWPF